jgi:hypothetical protein
MPNAPLIKEKFKFTQVAPIDLFNRFYALFGFLITISLYTACFSHLNTPAFDSLFWMAALSAPAWGLFYGAWVARQSWSWCLLILFSICSLIALGFRLSGQPAMFVAFGIAQATCVFWLIVTGIKLANWRNQ